jgi:hypothetical protein
MQETVNKIPNKIPNEILPGITLEEYKKLGLDEKTRLYEVAGKKAIQAALKMHKELGNPIAVLRDGKVIEIPASEIVLDSE